MASAMGLYLLTADREAAPEVYVAAAAKHQAGIVFGQMRSMANQSPLLLDYVKVQRTWIECPSNGGMMRVVASDAALQHGLNPSGNIIDELHAHKSGELYTALATGTSAREQPLTLWISTAGVAGEGVLGQIYGSMINGPGQLEKRDSLLIYRDRQAGVLIYWYGAPSDADPADHAVWLATNPASWMRANDGAELKKEYRKLVNRGALLDWRRFHLNQFVGVEETWLPMGAWDESRDPSRILNPALPIGVGVDKGQMHDRAAIAVAQQQGEDVIVRCRFFPVESATGKVSTLAMRVYLRELRGAYPMPQARHPTTKRPLPGPAIAYDKWAFTESADELEQDGLNMVDFPQWASTMGPASTTTYELITTRRLKHDGDPVLAEHVRNTTAILTERGMKVAKPKKPGAHPNDGCVALVMACAMAMQEAPAPYVRKPRVGIGF
jgi:phage terminase large subunit-like protein